MFGLSYGNRIVKLKNGTSSDRYVEIERLLRQFGIVDSMEEFRNNTTRYINEQLIKLIPLLICTVILVIVALCTISALNAKKRIKYVWNSVYMRFTMEKLSASYNLTKHCFITAFICGISSFCRHKYTGNYRSDELSQLFIWGFGNLLFVLAIVLIYILCSIIMPIGIMHNVTPQKKY